MKKFPVFLILLNLFVYTGCENGADETKISAHFSSQSHNTGKDCLTCHKKGGSGEGWFTLAGSVYTNSAGAVYPNATVYLSTESAGLGTPVRVIEVDNLGNFYTTESIDYGAGLYVSVIGTQNDSAWMHTKITAGNCNGCHGNTSDKIILY